MIEFSPLCIGRLNKSDSLSTILPLVDSVHLDIMDETFVPCTAFSCNEINNFETKKAKHVHIMSKNIEESINNLDNVSSISYHFEASNNHQILIKKIKEKKINAGLVIKSETQISSVTNILQYLDRIILMAVPPGFSGQKFIKSTTNKIRELRKINRDIEIVIDGGMNEQTMFEVTSAGADSCVVCSVIVKSENYLNTINSLKKMCDEGIKIYRQKIK